MMEFLESTEPGVHALNRAAAWPTVAMHGPLWRKPSEQGVLAFHFLSLRKEFLATARDGVLPGVH